jgi:UDP-GlcNAc:undecaprenyl-phosphate/decaprenyl-phosphate GlcNAc-1-phosphate transferase
MAKIPADLIAFIIALFASLVLTVPIRWFALRYGMVDKPGPRKVHVKPMPLLGGIAIYLSFALGVTLTRHGGPYEQILAILSGATLVAFVGFLDDGGLLHHQVKLFIGMPVAAIILLVSGVRAELFSQLIPGTIGTALDVCFTIFWVVGITAAFSILDHMDGLCAGIAGVAAAFFTLTAIFSGQTMVRVLGAAVLGAALGFLRWNFNPAKIFMGDGGAMFLGFLMATLGLKIRPEGAQFPVTWFVPVLILGIPVFDTMLISISRSRRGLLPFTSPGKDHTAHRLSNLGLGHRGAVLVLYALAFVSGLLSLVVSRVSLQIAIAIVLGLVFAGLAGVYLLETVPFEHQVKLQKSSPVS